MKQETYKGNASLFAKKSVQYLQNAMDEIRKVSHKLHQEGREDLSVGRAIKEVVYTINLSHKLNLNLEIEGKEYIDLYSATVSLTILRIIQEQLDNMIKYAQAENVEIKLHAGPTGAELELRMMEKDLV
ncbi:MAG: sensor histidine kinase [Flavisolibacter sp.]